MQHCTPEQLALAALQEPLPAADEAHLDACAACRAEVADLRSGPELLAVPHLAVPGAAVPPPPRVWEAIAAATGVSVSPASARDAAPAPAMSTLPAPADPPAARTPDESRTEGATVVPFRARRRPLLLVAAAVAVGAVVGAGAVAVAQRIGSDGDSVTTVDLNPLPDADADDDDADPSGVADLVVLDDGSLVLKVDLDAPALEGSYYQVWLIGECVAGMYPLGVVTTGTQTVELPTGLDLSAFHVVDISVEPLDGDPTHSGVSVARGEIEA